MSVYSDIFRFGYKDTLIIINMLERSCSMISNHFWENECLELWWGAHVCVSAKLLQLCLTLCPPMDCSPRDSSVHGILQAWMLEWIAILFSRDASTPGKPPRSWTWVSHIAGGFFIIWVTRKADGKYLLCWRRPALASLMVPPTYLFVPFIRSCLYKEALH